MADCWMWRLYGIYRQFMAIPGLFCNCCSHAPIDLLGFKQKAGESVKVKTAAYWSIAWVSVAALFGGGLWLYLKHSVGLKSPIPRSWNTLRVIYWKNHWR